MSNTSLLGAYGALGNSSLLFRNKVINGDMRIDQRNSGSLVAGDVGDTYGVDRTCVGVFGSGSGRMSAQRVEDAPSEFVYSLKAVVTTADTSQTAVEGYCLTQRIEAQNTLDLLLGTPSAKEITVSFWVKSSIAGTYVLNLQAETPTIAAYSELYTISSANTWEKKTITIPAATIGTWPTGNGRGLQVIWGLGGGSDRQAEQLNVWYQKSTGNAPTDAAGCVDFIANSGATFQITGVQLEAGPVATPFEHRPIGLELSLCQRYYETGFWYMRGISIASGARIQQNVNYLVSKRDIPSISLTGVTDSNPTASGGIKVGSVYLHAFHTSSTNFTGGSTGDVSIGFTWRANAEL